MILEIDKLTEFPYRSKETFFAYFLPPHSGVHDLTRT